MLDSRDVSPASVGWALVGIAVFGLVAFVLTRLVGAILLGLFLYYATRPACRWLDARVDHPNVNATVTLLLVGVPMLVILLYAAFVAVRELDQLLDLADLQNLRRLLQPYLNLTQVDEPARILSQLRGGVPQVLRVLGAIFTWGLRIFVAVTVAYFLLRDERKIRRWAERSFHDEYGVVSFLDGVDDDLTTIYTGNLLTIVITGLVAVVVYSGLNVVAPQGLGILFPLLLGLLTGVATLVPAVGMKIVYVPYVGFLFWRAWRHSGGASLWFPAAFLVVTFVVVDSVPDIFVRSYVSKGEINMGLIMLSYVLCAYAFGWYGVFLAPVVLAVFLHFAHRVFPNLLDPADTRLVSDDWPE